MFKLHLDLSKNKHFKYNITSEMLPQVKCNFVHALLKGKFWIVNSVRGNTEAECKHSTLLHNYSYSSSFYHQFSSILSNIIILFHTTYTALKFKDQYCSLDYAKMC